MVDFNEWSQDPFALFAAFLTLVITVTFISGIIFLFNDKKIKKIVGGLLEVGFIISVVALIMTLGAEKTQHPTFEEALATSYGYESVQCKGVGDVRDGDTPCVAYSNHGRKRQVITVVGDSKKNTVRVYDSQGNLVKPVLTKAPAKKGLLNQPYPEGTKWQTRNTCGKSNPSAVAKTADAWLKTPASMWNWMTASRSSGATTTIVPAGIARPAMADTGCKRI